MCVDERCCLWSEGNREMSYMWMRGVVCGVRRTGRCYMCG